MKKMIVLVALLPIAAMGAVVGPDQIQGQDQLQGQAQGQLQGQAQGQAQAVGVDVDVDNRVNSASFSAADADSRSSSASVSGALSGSVSGAEQSQDQTAVASNEGNSQNITFNAPDRVVMHQKGTAGLRTVPTAIAPNIYPTANCAMSASAGASTLGTGVSFGGTKVNHECVMLETARVYSQLGYPTQGLDILCSTPVSLEVFGDKASCLAAGVRVETAEASPSVVVLPAGVDKATVTEQIDRAFKTAVAK